MSDKFSNTSSENFRVSMIHPIDHAFAVAPNDAVDFEQPTRGLYVGVAGDVKVTLLGGEIVTYKDMAAGVTHAKRINRVWATGTTATDLIGEY